MAKYKAPSKNSKYYLPREDYLTAVHYALRYPLWVEELRVSADTGKAINYDKIKVQTSITGCEVEDLAIRRVELTQKKELVDSTIHEVARGMDDYIRFAVCYGLTYDQLLARKIPCGRRLYIEIRQRFYYELSKKI